MNPTDPLLAEAQHYGYVEADGVWLRPMLGQPARQVGHVRDSDAAALLYFAQRFAAFRQKVDDVLDKMATSENQGSHLVKALHLKGLTLIYDALGDFEVLHRRISEAETGQAVLIARNREKNLALKISLIAEAERLRDSTEWVTASEEVKATRQSWLKTGPVDKAIADELENRFQATIQTFYDRRKAFQADRKTMARRAQVRYQELVQQAEGLRESTSFEATSVQLKTLQADWREVKGTINKKTAAELWTRFRGANNYFFERLKVHIESQRATAGAPPTPEEMLERKRRLAERIEALVHSPPHEAVQQAKLLQTAWKAAGTVRGEESDRLWQRFMVACDRIFEQSALEYAIRKGLDGAPEPGTLPERARTRVVVLREFLQADEAEMATLCTNLDNLSATPANEALRQQLQTKIRSLERKIRTKNDLIVFFSRQAQAVS